MNVLRVQRPWIRLRDGAHMCQVSTLTYSQAPLWPQWPVPRNVARMLPLAKWATGFTAGRDS